MLKFFILITRWLARFLGVFLFLFFVWFAIEFGIDNPANLCPQLLRLFIAHIIMMIALLVVWRFEFLGGVILIITYIYFSIVNHTFWTNSIYPIFFFIGILHFISWSFRYGNRIVKDGFSLQYFFR